MQDRQESDPAREARPLELIQRPRRNRKSPAVRALVRETRLAPQDLVLPVFLHAGRDDEPIDAMPGCTRWSLAGLVEEARRARDVGVRAVCLFPRVSDELKTSDGREAWNEEGLVPRAVRALKDAVADLVVMTDVALDGEGFQEVSILAYTAKYASAYYGPFRGALDSSPRSGDKRTYQMDPANAREALRELALDEAEGADVVMVKPAGAYLDVIAALRSATELPVAAYQVSGEYLMIRAASASGWLDERSVVLESLLGIRRAGADLIFSYFARQAAAWLG